MYVCLYVYANVPSEEGPVGDAAFAAVGILDLPLLQFQPFNLSTMVIKWQVAIVQVAHATS